jgi:enoyl-CoA hydratase/carnithine racemase
MSYEFIKVEKKDHLTILTINRPERMNALHPPGSKELDQAFDEFANDPDAWVAIITGAGDRSLSAGNDLKWQAEHGIEALIKGMSEVKGGFAGITSRFDLFKPIICAVNGHALGGGLEIALACDIIIAAEHSQFGLPEPRVGLLAAAGGVQRLPQRLPWHVAMGLMLTGGRMSAQDALKWGLVNEVVPLAELLPTAERWAEQIMECAPLAIRGTKEGAALGRDKPIQETIQGFPGLMTVFTSEDAMEGAIAFASKRKPDWKGK